jgi:tRNA (adenine57-N1/adenine58-N1)-methyltransferase
VTTDADRPLLALRPTFAEQVQRGPRGGGFGVHPKDLGAIVLHADVSPGDVVVVVGGGEALAGTALRAVGPSGRVLAYAAVEELPDAAALAGGEVDRVLLAVAEPWRVLPGAAAALRPGGAVCAACVNAPSVQRFCEELRAAGGWGLIQTFEVLERGWTVRDRSLRPAHRMVGHTAFLTFARRLVGGAVFEAESEGF